MTKPDPHSPHCALRNPESVRDCNCGVDDTPVKEIESILAKGSDGTDTFIIPGESLRAVLEGLRGMKKRTVLAMNYAENKNTIVVLKDMLDEFRSLGVTDE